MALRTSVLLAICLMAVSCASGDAEAPSDPPSTLLPVAALPRTPAPTTSSTTTTFALPEDPAVADLRARADLRAVADAADEAFARYGSYDVDHLEIMALADGPTVISLEEAAAFDGVVYEPFGARVTLHRESTSGRWFCIDLGPDGRDHGFGDSFPASLASCTDGVQVASWGASFSPTGPDDAAVAGTWNALNEALASGQPAAALTVFEPTGDCTPADLESLWPPGLPLSGDEDPILEGVVIDELEATVDASLGPVPAGTWELKKAGPAWLFQANPCEVFGSFAVAAAQDAAADLLEDALFVIRSVFVVEQDFSFSVRHLENLDADLVWVEPEDAGFGALTWRGTGESGVVITGSGDGGFLCAVESAKAATRYGRGDTVDEVDSPAACSSRS